jgi:hypothetical protein
MDLLIYNFMELLLSLVFDHLMGTSWSLLFLVDGHGWCLYHDFGATFMSCLMDQSLDTQVFVSSCVIFSMEHHSD